MSELQNVTENKRPKIIHYCWFGGKPIPKDLQDFSIPSKSFIRQKRKESLERCWMILNPMSFI